MAWRDNLRDASFRGVAFHVLSNEAQHGRRTQLHEFPLRDKPFVEDLGRRARTFTIEAIVIGPDYMVARDALITAAEQAGAGKLVHPYYGEMQATLTEPLRVSETTAEGGSAKITMTFTEAGDLLYPTATPDTPAQVDARAQAAAAASAESFGDEFTVDGLPAFASMSALSTLSSALDQVQIASRIAQGDIGGRSVFDRLVGSLRGDASSLLSTPLALAQRVLDIFASLRALAPTGMAGQRALVGLGGFGGSLPAIPTTTTTRNQEADNQAALVELVRAAALIEAGRATATADFESYDQAITTRDATIDPMDALLEITPSDQVFSTMSDLRAAIVRDVAARGADLARLATYTPPATVPALVVAYGLYEDIAREGEIIARNAIRHPGFVPGGRALSVLTDG